MKKVEVRETSQVAEARRAAVCLAQAHGFGEADAGRVAIVSTELATNLIKHGGGGILLIGGYDDDGGSGIECLALDKGKGMVDVVASTRDGHSTAGSAGTGLGAVVRGSHASDIYSVPGLGTAILARFQQGRPGRGAAPDQPSYGGIDIPIKGEEVCGDAWCRKPLADGFAVVMADGLGHGPYAAEAANAATRVFLQSDIGEPSGMLVAMHEALRPTRGAAVGIARFDSSDAQIIFAGVGNIGGAIVDRDGKIRRMVSNNGTVGHIARHMRDFSYLVECPALMILASDGLVTSWQLDAYPGLVLRHPTLIAGVLYRDFGRQRDDVSVFVARLAAA